MIYGIGHDLLEIGRIQRILSQPAGQRFLDRVLTEAERALAAERGARLAEFAAGRFAAKEAVVKAFGCGIGEVIGFRDIEILPDSLGKPQCALAPEAWQRLNIPEQERIGFTIHISITHQPNLASAFAVIEKR
ncbi:Holo-[acyl-carrier-protein] synthase [Paenibacillus sp. CECT 9249]|uniref:holo-ACP synthase n=1 Tax=Paenibacillus sp. CECT 9249 TaxID=2845385 RepID=UPI001E612532|nr:holo-ACP synthase [Paenibacillus sp. CECT 9249]CAH0118872.1 Holo-[acyl-carrier-protein] synthase [Paenibacillus sp. CECT 9249]